MDPSRVSPAAGVDRLERRVLRDVGRFGRLSVLNFSLLLPLLGAAVVSPTLTAGQLAGLAAVALAFHVFGYVSNDVFDLPIDRTQPLRAGSPLVRGVVRPPVALAIALLPVPLACAIHLGMGGPPAAAAVLMVGMGLGLLYNARGKRVRFPPASDAVQGLAWVALMAYGALATGAVLDGRVAWLGATVFVYVLLVNGLHGGLRDLENDSSHGARTTALYLGARAAPGGRAVVPRRVAAFGLALEVGLMGLTAACVILYSPLLKWMSWPAIVSAIAVAHVALLSLARAALRPAASRSEVIRAGTAHLFLSMGVVFLPFASFAGRAAALAIVAAYALPLFILLPHLGLVSRKGRSPARSSATAVAALVCLLALVAPTARPAPPPAGDPDPAARVVTRQEIVRAMTLEREKGYNLLATANGARFAAGVVLELARSASGRDPLRTPLLLDHRDFFEAFVGVTGVSRENAPAYVRMAFDHREDQYVDYRQENVVSKIVRGRRPRFAVTVLGGWSGPPARYSYEDRGSEPPLRVTRERVTSYRLLDFGDMLLFDEIEGVSGRALGGLLGLLFRFIGEGHAVRSFTAISDDGHQVTLTTGRKGPLVLTTTATVDPSGRGEKGIPSGRADLRAIERRLKEPFEAEYAPIRSSDPARWRRATTER